MNLRAAGWCLLFTFSACVVRSHADEPAEWNMKVAGIRVVAPVADGKENSRGAFFSPPGVTVSVIVQPPAGKIVSINQFDSKLETFTDDRGTDLLAAKSDDPFNKPGIEMINVNKDGAAASMDFQAAGLPAKGAAALNLSGKLVVQTAGSTKQFTVENVEIKTNAQFSLGDTPIVISAVASRKDNFTKQDEVSVTFSSLKNLDNISSLEFYDAQGHKMDAHKRSWGGGFLGYMIEYVFKQRPENVKIVATCWQDLKTVDVPVSLKTGVGL